MFFIDHQKSKIFKGYVPLQQPVRADQQVHLAFGRPFERLALLAGRTETADHVYREAECFESVGKGLIMLLGQHRRRYEYSNLFAAHDRLERRPQCHFGFSEAYVAAQQTVHRHRLLHIRLDFGDSAQLIRRLFKWERFFELRLPRRVRQERKSRGDTAPSIEFQKFPRQIGDRRLSLRLGPGPVGAAQFRQLRGFPFGADIFLQQLDLIGRHIQLVIRGIADMEIVPMHPVQFDRFDPGILADAMSDMHYIVADLQFGVIGDPPRLTGPAAPLQLHPPFDLAFGNDRQSVFRQFEPARQIACHDKNARPFDQISIRRRLRRHALLEKVFPQDRRRLQAGHHQYDLVSPRLPTLDIIQQEVDFPVVGGNAPQADSTRTMGHGVFQAIAQQGEKAALRFRQRLLLQPIPLDGPGGNIVVRLPQVVQGFFQPDRFIEDDAGALRQIGDHTAVGGVFPGIRRRQQGNRRQGFDRTLRDRMIFADRIDHVVKELDPYRIR